MTRSPRAGCWRTALSSAQAAAARTALADRARAAVKGDKPALSALLRKPVAEPMPEPEHAAPANARPGDDFRALLRRLSDEDDEPTATFSPRAAEMAQALGLPVAALAQYPAELSGGMQSRAALARALVLAPALLLMDEPFAALDVGLRSQLHQLLLARQAHTGMAVLLITHDLMEAVRLADEVLVMAASPGRIVARYHPPGAAVARGDALVHRCAAELQQHPAVRVAFGLPDRAGSATDAEDSVAAAGTWHATAAMVGGPQRSGC